MSGTCELSRYRLRPAEVVGELVALSVVESTFTPGLVLDVELSNSVGQTSAEAMLEWRP